MGKLQNIGYFSTRGETPRDFNIVSNGRILVVANQDSNEVLTFKINYKKNEVINLDRIRIEQPICVEKWGKYENKNNISKTCRMCW